MQLLKFWFSMLTLVVCALAAEPPKELDVAVTFLPDDCPITAKTGDAIKVHYTGKLFTDGSKFDSSFDRGQPLPIKLGVGQVIKGWDDGLQDMCLNEKRTLTIPSDMAYGTRGFGKIIPANSALVFDVELVGLEKSETSRDEL
ncbi:hypothetical protein AZE42_08857 [Rhizopogon vesiculosus]|uniref:peptidylprolyl isomerase n=1 Tax=Rhizopogon vesiculosus TaxID=180088 RepID=A0A1J8QAH1_9AGAM|nr:hypothetical protein AZE42_08857 [Rhizopogon vesiculosus]